MPVISTPPSLSRELEHWYQTTARDLPWRRAEFHQQFGAWGTLVSEFMLQQTPVTRVIPHLEAWLERWPTPELMSRATPAEVVQQWANLGYPRRALWLHRAGIQITERHAGAVPREVDALLALSGIGDYTARAVAAFAFGDRHPVVDTNTRRVLARVLDGKSQPAPPARSDLVTMTALLPESDAESAVFNAAMMELGATVCTARAPKCDQCPIVAFCAWVAAGRPDTGDMRRKQARYEGSDRQARGAVLKALREVPDGAVPVDDIIHDWTDLAQRHRAIDSLIADGLIEAVDGMLRLPH